MPKPDDRSGPKRRQFSREYKVGIVKQYDALTDSLERGALLRREGIYTSHIALWRGVLREGKPIAKRGRKPKSEESRDLERLRKEVAKLRSDLAKAEKIIEVQGKVSALLHQLADKSHAETSE